MEACGGSEKGDMRAEKRVQIETEESGLEDSRSESKDTQVILTHVAYDILLVLIETFHRVTLIALTSWDFLGVEMVWLKVEHGRMKKEWELMLHMQNISSLQGYVDRLLGGIV